MKKLIPIQVTRIGKVTHLKGEVGFRPASYQKRGKIAKEVLKGVSNVYYKNLRKTPIPELMAGNITVKGVHCPLLLMDTGLMSLSSC